MTQWIQGQANPRTSLDKMERRYISATAKNQTLVPQLFSSYRSHYTVTTLPELSQLHQHSTLFQTNAQIIWFY